MLRWFMVSALVCTTASVAQAKDVCVQIDGGGAAGATVFMRGVKGGRGTFGPVHGYVNYPDTVTSVARLSPAAGEALVSSTGDLVVGMTWHEVTLYPNGGTNVLNDLIAVHLACHAGTDGKLGEMDLCDAYVTDFGTAHVISCKDVARVP
jgi:hypothetical protein